MISAPSVSVLTRRALGPWLCAVFLSALPSLAQVSELPAEPDFAALLQPVPFAAKFADPDYYIWCGTLVRGDDGKSHLFYSRWPRKLGHYAWVTHSEVAHAVADSPLGTFRHVDVANPARLDFRLRPDSAVVKALPGFKPISFEQIGLVQDDYRTTLSDILRCLEPGRRGGAAFDSNTDVQRTNRRRAARPSATASRRRRPCARSCR